MRIEIRRKLDRITDILFAGGVTNPVTYIEQISYLIYLKLLDEEEGKRQLYARLKENKTNGNGKMLFPKQGREIPLVQVAFHEWSGSARFCARQGFPLHEFPWLRKNHRSPNISATPYSRSSIPTSSSRWSMK